MSDNPFEVEDLDVDTNDTDEVVEEAAEPTGTPGEKKAKAPARPPVPEGYVTPVTFAKILTEHLHQKGVSNKNGPIDPQSNPVPPQMVYSYINNSRKPGSKNPFPTYEVDGRQNLIKPEEGLAWWDEKDKRAAERAANAAARAAKKAARKAEKAEKGDDTPATVEEAE